MHDNIIQLLFLDAIKNKIEMLETYRKDNQLYIQLKLKQSNLTCLVCKGPLKFHSYRLKHILYGISSFEAYHIEYQSRRYKCPNCGKYQTEPNPFSLKWWL